MVQWSSGGVKRAEDVELECDDDSGRQSKRPAGEVEVDTRGRGPVSRQREETRARKEGTGTHTYIYGCRRLTIWLVDELRVQPGWVTLPSSPVAG